MEKFLEDIRKASHYGEVRRSIGRKFVASYLLSMQTSKILSRICLNLSKLPKKFARNQEMFGSITHPAKFTSELKGATIPESVGDQFYQEHQNFPPMNYRNFHTKSRTFSIYYPDTRPHRKDPRYSIVASLNAKWKRLGKLSNEEYSKAKDRLCEESLDALEKIIPDVNG